MIYTLQINSPDFFKLTQAVTNAITERTNYAHKMAREWGRTSLQHRSVIEQIEAYQRVLAGLKAAEATATPERAIQTSETPARNAGDEIRYVYGKPRNDPRDAKTGLHRQGRK